MFGGVNHSKLKTNLKLAIQRLKLLEKKKTENARKSTKEIADFIQINKYDRARIKVEHIIREDYLVEGMEIIEMYCDLLLARFGLVESMKELDLGLYECVSSLIWVAPRLESEVSELKIISDELERKYGKEFAQMCRANNAQKVNERLMQKMSEQAPGELLVEKYLVEISKSHNVQFQPNPDITIRDPYFFYDSMEQHKKNNNSGNNGGSNGNGGGGGLGESVIVGGSTSTSSDNVTSAIYPTNQQVSYIGFNQPKESQQAPVKKLNTAANDNFEYPSVPDALPYLPGQVIPSSNANNNNKPGSDSFDDLAARFEKLKKK